MRRPLALLVLAFALALGAMPAAAAQAPDLAPLHTADSAVDGSYIVVLESGRSASTVAQQAGVAPSRVYSTVLDGFSATLSPSQLERVRRDPDVAYIEQDQIATLVHHRIQGNPPSWGLDRIDQRFLPLNNRYVWHADATKVNAYVFDTGLEYNHWDFGGRAHFALDVFGGNGSDCHGHGTHVGGTIGGKSHGVSKQVQLWSVRVLNCAGSGSYAGIIAAADWVALNHKKPAVANFSLGGGFSQAVNDAIDNLSNSGVFVAAAAGNSAANTCTFTPASAPEAYAVAASDSSDNSAWFTNHGTCVEIYAPGVDITSAWLNGGTNTISGTSMAAPHVAGVAAQYKAYGDQPSSVVRNFITQQGTPNVLTGVPNNTPNLLLFKTWRL